MAVKSSRTSRSRSACSAGLRPYHSTRSCSFASGMGAAARAGRRAHDTAEGVRTLLFLPHTRGRRPDRAAPVVRASLHSASRHRLRGAPNAVATGRSSMRIAVIGAGAMGRWAVKELALSPEVEEIVVGDYNEEQARAVATTHGGDKAKAMFVDAREPESVKKAIVGCGAMINATQHFWNITVMHAAAAAGVHYTDMGGLFHVTKQQVELDGEFRKAGVTAVIAMGGAPGVTNVLARYGAERLDTVEEAHAYCGNVDDTDWSRYDGWVVPYSLETLCDEFSVAAPQFIDGKWNTDIVGGTGLEDVDFGAPAGILEAHHTIHSEPFSFWHTWKDQGL
ncbi:MAG: hypothetical protein EHM52_02600, partial [Actinomycetota bacterium]